MAGIGLVVLLALNLAAFLRAPKDWRGCRPVASGYVVIVATIFLFIALPAVAVYFRNSYVWAPAYFNADNFAAAIWLVNFALAAFLYGYFFYRAHVKDPDFKSPEASVGHRDSGPFQSTLPLVTLFIVVGVGIKIFLILSVGGLSNAVVLLSGFGRSEVGVDPQSPLSSSQIMLRVVSGMADGAAAWGLLTAFRQRRGVKTWTIILMLVLGLTFLTIGKRLILLFPLFLVVLGLHFYRRALTIKLLPALVLGAVIFGLLTISIRGLLPALLLGREVDFNASNYAQGSFLLYYLYSLEFAMIEMITVVMVGRDNIMNMFGGAWDAFWATNIEPLFYTVPRALWPGKPTMFYDVSYGVSAELGYGSIDDPSVGYAPTLIGTAFFFAGVIGVGVALFLLGLLAARVDRRLTQRDWTGRDIVIYALALVIVFHLFRQGSIGYALVISFSQQYGAIGAALLLSYVEQSHRRVRRKARRQIEPANRGSTTGSRIGKTEIPLT